MFFVCMRQDSLSPPAGRYPDIEYKEMIVDNTCMQLVRLHMCRDHVRMTPRCWPNAVNSTECNFAEYRRVHRRLMS